MLRHHPFFYFSAYERKSKPTSAFMYKRVARALIGSRTAGIDGVVTRLNGSNEGHVVGI